MRNKQSFINEPYESPQTRTMVVSPMRCIADSVRGAALQDMQNNSIYTDEDF